MSSLKVKRARKRIKSANAAATEPMKLCNRTRSALDFLLQCKNISRIVGALVNLGELKLDEYDQPATLSFWLEYSVMLHVLVGFLTS